MDKELLQKLAAVYEQEGYFGMRDFIFIIGASGIGKTTLAKKLYEHYQGAYVEMGIVPEFGVPKSVDKGLFEEQVCWESCVAQIKKFWEFGIRNIVALDFDDLRTRDIPEVFKGFNYITIKLICSDYRQNYEQMNNRENGLIDFELLEKMSIKINARKCLVNEFELDIAGKTSNQVFAEAVQMIEHEEIKMEYDYVKPQKELFYSWVFSNGLR